MHFCHTLQLPDKTSVILIENRLGNLIKFICIILIFGICISLLWGPADCHSSWSIHELSFHGKDISTHFMVKTQALISWSRHEHSFHGQVNNYIVNSYRLVIVNNQQEEPIIFM